MWQLAFSLSVLEAWQFSEPIAGEFFRLTHIYPFGIYRRGQICQASNETLYGIARLYPKQQQEVYQFKSPICFADQRSIGMRCSDNIAGEWTVFIEVWG